MTARQSSRGSASHRSERVSERIQQEISLMLQRDVRDPRLANVNVTRVEVSGDLRYAKIYVTPRDSDEENSEMMEGLARAAGYFRHQLAMTVDLRYTPEVRFYVDPAIKQGEHFLQVLDEVRVEQAQTAKRKQ
jgi:ribosome-binding factor A